MPNDFRVRGGTTVSNYPPPALAVTDEQFENIIRAYCEATGISTQGNKQAILDRYTQHLWDHTRIVARERRRLKKQGSALAAIDAEIDMELGV